MMSNIKTDVIQFVSFNEKVTLVQQRLKFLKFEVC
jgi:hypothetical protein